MYARVETITPEIAQAYLRRNNLNRSIRRAAVKAYARDMKNGKWQLSPQGISFYEDGTLADGQHRLWAVIEANVSVQMFVIYDIPNDSKVLDVGIKRNATDILKFSGVDTDNYVVATVRFMFRYGGPAEPTIQIIHDFVSDYHDILNDVAICSCHGSKSKYLLTRKSSIQSAAFCAVYCGVPIETVDAFLTAVNSGYYNIENGESASAVLRNHIIRNFTGKTSGNHFDMFRQTCFAIKDYANHTNRKFAYPTTAKIPFWCEVKENVISPYLKNE